jgi:hypothetical protein
MMINLRGGRLALGTIICNRRAYRIYKRDRAACCLVGGRQAKLKAAEPWSSRFAKHQVGTSRKMKLTARPQYEAGVCHYFFFLFIFFFFFIAMTGFLVGC